MKKILFVFGTRPEAIKLAPVILKMQEFSQEFEICVCNTAQHREIVQEPIDLFKIKVDIDLDIMRPNQDLFDITHRLFHAFKEKVFPQFKPDQIVVQGDTTTTMVAAMSSFYAGIPLAHVEAGLRTYRMDSPFPEEFNRRVCSLIASKHFCPTQWARKNLLRENVPDEKIYVTGNTSIDSILWLLHEYQPDFFEQHVQKKYPELNKLLAHQKESSLVVITLHRREHFGPSFTKILDALRQLAEDFPDIDWVYPVHPNPNIRVPAYQRLSSISNFYLIYPLDYLSFIYVMKRSKLILTDSGGVQEEAPTLGKPVLVVRDTTERPEGIEAGTARLIGIEPAQIIDHVNELLTDPEEYQRMATVKNPYGDGHAAERIVEALR